MKQTSKFNTALIGCFSLLSTVTMAGFLVIDGMPVENNFMILPEKETYLIEFPEPDNIKQYSGDAQRSSKLTLRRNDEIEVSVSSGFLKPETATKVRWFPDSKEKLAEITYNQTVESFSIIEEEESTGRSTGGTGNAFVLLPHKYNRNGDGVLAGAIIGIYPDELSPNAPAPVQRNKEAYAPPIDFYEISPETEDKFISKYARLQNIAPKTVESSTNRLVAIDLDLLTFWDALNDNMLELGYSTEGLMILRGFVSPQDRQRMQRLGIELAEFTRFQYGDALGIIYDEDNNFRMDDMNSDGKIDIEDVRVLSQIVRDTMSENSMYGGVGLSSSFEGPNNIGTPYLHVDLRGWNLNWEE